MATGGEGTPGSTPKREVAQEERPEGHWEGADTWGPFSRAKNRVASSSAEGASCLTHPMKLAGAPSPPCPTEEVVVRGEVGFEESWQEYPILKIPPSCSHPKNTSATNFPQCTILPFPFQSGLVCLSQAPWGGTSSFACWPPPLPPSPGKLALPLGTGTWEGCNALGKVSWS